MSGLSGDNIAPPGWERRFYGPALRLVREHGEQEALGRAVRLLYSEQREHWPTLAAALSKLAGSQLRDIEVDGRTLTLQHNPARLTNATAAPARERKGDSPCPLCPHNMPVEQEGVPFGSDWFAVCNPLPLFDTHLVLVSREHRPQTALGVAGDMLRFTQLTGLATYYNGPNSGASIPEHMHLQAGNPAPLPLASQLPPASEFPGIVADDRLPHRIYIGGTSTEETARLFERTIPLLNRGCGRPESSEPELNLAALCTGERESPVLTVHPRYRHRPSCYHAGGEERYLVSPGAADMAGLVILPRGEDFRRLTAGLMRTVFSEICMPPDNFRRLIQELAQISIRHA